jgi:diguanylate cyclase (GGDEF)-like protein
MGRVRAGKLKLLFVDPQKIAHGDLRKLLDKARFFKCELLVVESIEDAQESLEASEFDLLVLNGTEGNEEVRLCLDERLPVHLDVPVIVVTQEAEDRLALEAVTAGAQDYLVLEGLAPDTIDRAVRYAVERHRLIADLKELSLYDSLTGLYNRRAFTTLSLQQLKFAERTYARMLVFFADLDNLKFVNDTFGHQEGDRLLKRSAKVIRKTFRDSDVVARLGGDEFAVLAAESQVRGAERALMRLRKNIEVHNNNPAHRVDIAMSVGVALYDPSRPRTLEELISRADRLMYAEKKRKKARAARKRTAEGKLTDSHH